MSEPVLEVAILNVIEGKANAFEKAFAEAQKIISMMDGYISHELKRSLEVDNQYILLVTWRSVEDHREGFRQSPEYQQWKELLHHFYDPFPTVEYYKSVEL